MVVTLCMILPQVLATVDVASVTVMPTARVQRVSAVGTWMAVSILKESYAVGMATADATAASA